LINIVLAFGKTPDRKTRPRRRLGDPGKKTGADQSHPPGIAAPHSPARTKRRRCGRFLQQSAGETKRKPIEQTAAKAAKKTKTCESTLVVLLLFLRELLFKAFGITLGVE
jgi:hypothetical protein